MPRYCCVLLVELIAASAAHAQQLPLVGTEFALYDPETGNITLNGLVAAHGFEAISSDQDFDTRAFERSPAIRNRAIVDVRHPMIFQAITGVPWEGDGLDFGNFFPTGLSQGDLDANYSIGIIVGPASGVPDLIPLRLVPEPTATPLLAVALACLGKRRRV